MSPTGSHLDVPYEKRWDLLKPTIIEIYLEERATLEQLRKRMEDDFRFSAQIHQYRYRLRGWGIKKRTTTAEKEAVITILGKRSRDNAIGTSDIQLEQSLLRPVDRKQLRRYINDSIRTKRPISIRPGLFFSRTLPYSALFRSLEGHPYDSLSLHSSRPHLAGCLAITGPQGQRADASPQEDMCLITQLVHKKVLLDRAQLLVDGRDLDLIKQLTRDERQIVADWLHDFWVFSFITTKYWGKGPKDWTLPLINLKTLAGAIDESPEGHPDRSQELDIARSQHTYVIDPPTQLCKWSIHINYRDIDCESDNSQSSCTESDIGDDFDITLEDESTWREWDGQDDRDLTSAITEGLQTNAFTTQRAEDLPLAIDYMVKAVSGSMQDAEVEAIGFAIMTRKVCALFEMLEKEEFNREALRAICPFHMAATYLDGSRACCSVMWELLVQLTNELSIGINYTDDRGLTVLDTLFITTLRSHSSITSFALERILAVPSSMFEGVDVDICGRWDADSPCVRALHTAGETTIPKEWKHMFCHTSAQAVCHCLTVIFMELWAPNINTTSGLFRRRCRSCGLELKLGPLHAFVLVCFHLARACRPGETLFGMLACLVCLLTLRADPSVSAEISLPAILGFDETEECQHQSFNAAELASAVPSSVVDAWTPEVKLGWEAIKAVLNHCVRRGQTSTINMTDLPVNLSASPHSAVHNHDEGSEKGSGSKRDDEPCPHDIHLVESEDKMQYVKCGDKRLGTIWAAIQVELLTYRRLEVGDPWLSSEFDMRDVTEGLRRSNDSILVHLVENRGKGMLQSFSTCGLFLKVDNPGCARREEACPRCFDNLVDWERTTFTQSRANFWTRLVASS